MRTTLDIADDVLLAAKDLAKTSRTSVGEVVSNLARAGFAAGQVESGRGSPAGGLPMLPRRGGLVSNEAVNRLREELGV